MHCVEFMVECSSFKSGLRLVLPVLIVFWRESRPVETTTWVCVLLSLPFALSSTLAVWKESQRPRYTHARSVQWYYSARRRASTERSDSLAVASMCPSGSHQENPAARPWCPWAQGLRNISLPLNSSSQDHEDKETRDTHVAHSSECRLSLFKQIFWLESTGTKASATYVLWHNYIPT